MMRMEFDPLGLSKSFSPPRHQDHQGEQYPAMAVLGALVSWWWSWLCS